MPGHRGRLCAMTTTEPQQLWGGETAKAIDNFPVSGEPIPVSVARWLGRIKAASARANAALGLLDQDIADRIAAAGDRVAAGEFDDQFPIDVFQTGSGTSSNMNANEVIAKLATETGAPSLWQNSPVLVVILAGGFTTNFLWCLFLNIKNRTAKNYLNSGQVSLLSNYLFSAMAGVVWYLQFMFYGMGSTKMGKYTFSSWTIHMALIIVFSNIWGLIFREWKGSSKRTMRIITAGIFVVLLSIVFIGAGNYLASLGK